MRKWSGSRRNCLYWFHCLWRDPGSICRLGTGRDRFSPIMIKVPQIFLSSGAFFVKFIVVKKTVSGAVDRGRCATGRQFR